MGIEVAKKKKYKKTRSSGVKKPLTFFVKKNIKSSQSKVSYHNIDIVGAIIRSRVQIKTKSIKFEFDISCH